MMVFITEHSTAIYVLYAVIQALILLRVMNFMSKDAPILFFIACFAFAPVITGLLLIDAFERFLKFVIGNPK